MAYKMAFERFSSIHSLLTYNETRKPNAAFEGESELASNSGSKSFTGTKSYEEAKQLIESGWDGPLDKIKDATAKAPVKSNTQAERRRPSTGIVGYSPCVPNAIMGLPNSMIASAVIKQKVKAVTLVYGPTVSASWSTDEIEKCGITMLKIINMLELHGIRVRLTIEGFASTQGRDLSTMWVDVKDWREALDIKKMTFPVAHPSMLRRIAFRWLETCPDVKNSSYTSGYGTPLGVKDYEAVLAEYKEQGLLKDNEYYINAQLCKECRQDIDKIMKKAGMLGLKLEMERKGA